MCVSLSLSLSLFFLILRIKWDRICCCRTIINTKTITVAQDYFALTESMLLFWEYSIIFFLIWSWPALTHKLAFSYHKVERIWASWRLFSSREVQSSEFTDVRDWLMLVWLTEEREYASPESIATFDLLAICSCGIIRIQALHWSPDDVGNVFSCTTQKPITYI